MIPHACKRLAEVDFPLERVNKACVEENNRKTRVESGHISLLHAWWARRPLSSCRAILLGLLLPDPCDEHCPKAFKTAAWKALADFDFMKGMTPGDENLRRALLTFIATLAPWDIVSTAGYVSTARTLIEAAYGSVPQVFDPFAGGGSIPLEAQRLGCEVTASDLNPVAWLLLKITLDWCPRYGNRLADLFDEWSGRVLKESERRLAAYYPPDEQGRKPLAYLWARTITCEAPGCGVTIPLIRTLSLSEAPGRRKAVRITYNHGSLEPDIQVFVPPGGKGHRQRHGGPDECHLPTVPCGDPPGACPGPVTGAEGGYR